MEEQEILQINFDMMFMIATLVYHADNIRKASATNDPEQIARGISGMISQMELMDQVGFVEDMCAFRREVVNEKFK